ncbi:KOW motif-containing protein [Alkalicoccus luteus]|uniref:KOW motif-containing protein n=1 Tax=Alkalicoccus luteus TaxID=1237094 RepID=UPI00403345CF
MSEEQQEVLVQSGDQVLVTAGEYKGELAKVISPYTNSISIELEKRDADGTKPRTVLRHSEYELVEKA